MVIDCNFDESDQGIEAIPLHYFKAVGEGDDLSVWLYFLSMCDDFTNLTMPAASWP